MKHLKAFEDFENEFDENDEICENPPCDDNDDWQETEDGVKHKLTNRDDDDETPYDRHSRENRLPEPPSEITLEKKKSKGLPPWLKKGGKKKEEEGDDKTAKGKDAKGKDDKDDKSKDLKGLTAAQKKLPAGLQKAILAKKKK